MGAVENLVFCDGHRQRDAIQFHGTSVDFYVGLRIELVRQSKPLRRAKYALWYGPTGEYVFDGAHYGGTRDDSPRVVENSRGEACFRRISVAST